MLLRTALFETNRRWMPVTLGVLAMACLSAAPAWASGCADPTATWNLHANGNWFGDSAWSPNIDPNSLCTNVLIQDGTSTVTLNGTSIINNLTLNSGNILNFNNGSILSVNGGSILNAGAINLNGSGGVTYLQINGPASSTTTLSGGGTLTLAGGNNTVIYNSVNSGQVLENVDNKIVGVGQIGDGGGGFNLGLKNDASGILNANVNGGVLNLVLAGGITNAGTLEATNGGQLQIYYSVNNAGGTLSTDSNPNSVVYLESNSSIQGGTLNGNIQTAGNTTLDGSTQTVNNQQTFTINNGGSAVILGTINNTGTILMAGTGGGTYLNIGGAASSTTLLTGGGTVSMQGNSNNTLIYNSVNTNQILENFNNKIQGSGLIGDGGGGYNMALKNDAGGLINANLTGQTLELNPGGGLTNLGTLEATNGGILQISTTVANAGGTIFGDGTTSSVVNLTGATIQGGTLQGNVQVTSSATLDGTTNTLNNQGTLTLNEGTTTTVLGTINNTGSILMAGTGGGTYLNINGAANSTTTLQGGGTLTLQGSNNTLIYNAVNTGQTLENFDNKIVGVGQIGDNNGGYNLVLQNDIGGTVNANVSGMTLTLNANTTNFGTLEATGGGTLAITHATINNNPNLTAAGGTISADGTSQVTLNAATIEGGTLKGNIQLIGATTLDGTTQGTLNNQGTVTINEGVTATVLGTINNTGSILMAGTGGSTVLNIGGAGGSTTKLEGGGTLTLQGGNNTLIYNTVNTSQTLENFDNKIVGVGKIGDNNGGYNLTLQNDVGGTVNANVNSGTLTLNTNTTNLGTLEATGGGTLAIVNATVNNNSGTISTDGTSQVTLNAANIEGGTLNGNVQVIGESLLDGTTQGTLTNAGTVTLNEGVRTDIQGTINNTGTITLAGTGGSTILNVANDTKLQGGGTLTLQGGGNTVIYNVSNVGQTLENVNNTIQGVGRIGFAVLGYNMTVTNDVGGTILANGGTGTTLQIDAPLTNNGTLQVTAGSTMHLTSGLTNFGGSTLTGGTYNVAGTAGAPNVGTLQIDALGSTGGEIVHNAATIILDGPTAQITDKENLNALANFQDNMAAGSFTVENGQLFSTTPAGKADFTNEGAVKVDGTSSFTTSGNYTQSAGTTQVDGTLTATGGQINISGGTLSGLGTAVGNVTIGAAGTLSPGDPGNFNIIGGLTLTGTYDEAIAGQNVPNTGKYDFVSVTGAAALTGGTLDIALLNGFIPVAGQQYVILDAAGGLGGTEFANVEGLNYNGGFFTIGYVNNDDEVVLNANNNPINGSPTPEPAEFLPIVGIVAALVGRRLRNRRKAASAAL